MAGRGDRSSARSARAAGDQSALSGRGHRPARDGRRSQIPAPAVRAPSSAKYVVAEKMPGRGVQSDDELLDYAAERLDRLTCQLQLHDGQPYDERRRQRAQGAWPGRAARHRRFDHASGELDHHQRANDHDRREGCRDDQGRHTAKAGRLKSLSPLRQSSIATARFRSRHRQLGLVRGDASSCP